MHKNQFGFGAVEAVLILVIVGIIGGAGWYVMKANKNIDKTNASTAESSATTPAVQTKQEATKSEDKNTPTKETYLTIKEWGVKIPLSNNISTAYYSLNKEINRATISLNKYKGTNCAADNYTQLYSISRSAEANDKGVKVGSYYYSPSHPQTGCDGTSNGTWEPNSAGATEAMSYATEIKVAIGQIVAE